jgi:ligand-binding SRPBCC domain-containing protein
MRNGGVILIERSTRIARSIREVFAFYDAPDNLRRVTPSSLGIELERLPRDLRPGSIFGYRLRGWPLELRWEALVSEYHPPAFFVSVQSKGRFLQWSHEHHFASEGTSTRVRELLKYQMPKGLMSSLAHKLYVREKLQEFVAAGLENVRAELERRAFDAS